MNNTLKKIFEPTLFFTICTFFLLFLILVPEMISPEQCYEKITSSMLLDFGLYFIATMAWVYIIQTVFVLCNRFFGSSDNVFHKFPFFNQIFPIIVIVYSLWLGYEAYMSYFCLNG